MKMPKWFALLPVLALLCAPGMVLAAQHTDDWCADAVDFAIQTALHKNLGDAHAVMSGNIDKQYVVFVQQYPSLSKEDMHRLVDQAFVHHWTRFGAAEAVIDECDAANHARPPSYHAPYLSASHSDNWCADAVDYGMFTALNRDYDYSRKELDDSVKANDYTYGELFPALKTGDLLNLNHSVYKEEWSRFAAADAIGRACKVSNIRETAVKRP